MNEKEDEAIRANEWKKTRPSPSQVIEWKEDEGEKANNNETSWWNV